MSIKLVFTQISKLKNDCVILLCLAKNQVNYKRLIKS